MVAVALVKRLDFTCLSRSRTAFAAAALTLHPVPLPVWNMSSGFNSGKMPSIVTAFSFVSVRSEMLPAQCHFFFKHGNALDNAITIRVL
jgi:hypothetical protein